MLPSNAVHNVSARPASLIALIVINVRRTSGCTMIGSAGLSGNFGPGQRAALQTLLGVSGRILIRDLRHREPLHADAEPRLVHHHEHRGEAAIFLTDQIAHRIVVIHHTGGIAVDAHLVLDRAAGDAVLRAERAVGIDQDFGTMKSEMPFVPSGAPSMRASTRCTMFSVRSCSPPEMKILVPLILKEPSAVVAALVRRSPKVRCRNAAR